MRRALEDARAETPPPSLKEIGRQLGYTAEGTVVGLFPGLFDSYRNGERIGLKTIETESAF
jgi:hypothetical protein